VNRSVGAYEAKTHLPRLLEEVAAGATITITKHGVPVATLAPAGPSRSEAKDAVEQLRAFRAKHPLRGLKIRDLIDEGRRW
jgi:prevent-host-death family protein